MATGTTNRLASLQYALQRALLQVKRPTLHDTFHLLLLYDLFAGEVYRLRRSARVSAATRAASEDLLALATHQLASLRAPLPQTRHEPRWRDRYREIWLREFSLFLFTLCFFVSSMILGWVFGAHRPEYLPLLLPQHLAEAIIEGNAWFAELQDGPLIDGLTIAWNNIHVALNCFIFAAVLGLGGLALLCFNGVFFGATLGFCAIHGFDRTLAAFVVAHGPLELTIIIAATFSGLLYGRAFFTRPYRNFLYNFRQGARAAGCVVLGIVPWLIIAALVESMVSPWDYLSLQGKVLLGLGLALAFWLWTFAPTGRQTSSADSREQGPSATG